MIDPPNLLEQFPLCELEPPPSGWWFIVYVGGLMHKKYRLVPVHYVQAEGALTDIYDDPTVLDRGGEYFYRETDRKF